MKVKFSKKEIPKISQKLLERILKMKNNKAKVVALSGELGAGKTTLTQEIAKQIGINENVISPTYIIMKIYEINPSSKYYSSFKNLIHIDAYRLDSYLELLKIGWEELKKDKDNLIIIEWPENVKNCLDKATCWVKLGHVDDQTRAVEFLV
jgi:tRNA threonylcarbamoyladenosine biosynthesis protein TsaE